MAKGSQLQTEEPVRAHDGRVRLRRRSGRPEAPLETLRTLLLALIQGITEFLPISSSAHLILPSELLGWEDQGLAFDVAVHLGTLVAVLGYFRHELLGMVRGALEGARTRELNADLTLALAVAAGTLPVLVAGLLAKDLVETTLRSASVIAAATIGFALLLWYADRRHVRLHPQGRSEYALRPRDVAVIGLAQCLALIPGTSRSGITMTAGLLVGLSREGAARYSFLLAIPTIAGAALLTGLDVLDGGAAVAWPQLALGFAVSALAAYACIGFFLALLERTGFLPYVIYRLALGGLLIVLIV